MHHLTSDDKLQTLFLQKLSHLTWNQVSINRQDASSLTSTLEENATIIIYKYLNVFKTWHAAGFLGLVLLPGRCDLQGLLGLPWVLWRCWHTSIHPFMHANSFIHTVYCTRTYTLTLIHSFTHTYTSIHLYIITNTHIHILHTHTHIPACVHHTYIHIHLQTYLSPSKKRFKGLFAHLFLVPRRRCSIPPKSEEFLLNRNEFAALNSGQLLHNGGVHIWCISMHALL